MSKFRAEQLGQPINLSGSFTGSLQGTSSFATTASYALFAANGGGGSTNTGSLLTTASVASNTITFTKGDGSTFPITVATGSGGSGTVGPGAQNYLAFFSGSTTTISSSVIYQSGSTGIGIFTAAPTYSVDVFLAGKGDNGFRLRTGTFPNPDVLYTNQKDIYIPNLIDAGIFTSPPLPLSSLNVVLSDPNDSGRLYRTGSGAFGGGGGTGSGFPFSGSAVITGSLLVSGSNPLTLRTLPTSSLTNDRVRPVRVNGSTGQLTYDNFEQFTILFTDENTYTVLINTISKTPVISKQSTGVYSIKYNSSTLTANKTAVTLSPGTDLDGFVRYRIQDATEIRIYSYDFSGLGGAPAAADNFREALLDIKVYS